MDATTTTSQSACPDELVILIHGTYAASSSDQGTAWWQCGSPAWRQLAGKLPANVQLTAEGEVFHWSAENSERARSKAGRDLLARIGQLEAAGRPYHLIGHSHGDTLAQPTPLPPWLCDKITREADKHASNIAPHLRCLLAQPSFASGLETFSNTITGHELVHTSYFDHTEVLELLAAHVTWSRGKTIALSHEAPANPSLSSWFHRFKACLGERAACEPRSSLLIPRRAA